MDGRTSVGNQCDPGASQSSHDRRRESDRIHNVSSNLIEEDKRRSQTPSGCEQDEEMERPSIQFRCFVSFTQCDVVLKKSLITESPTSECGFHYKLHVF